jgi:hypothetical protein
MISNAKAELGMKPPRPSSIRLAIHNQPLCTL